MNESGRKYGLTALALLLATPLASCSPAAAPEPPLAGAAIGGPFALTDQDGKRVRDTDFAGRYRVVYFGYTFCPDVCPVDVQLIAQGLRQFEKTDPKRAARVQPIFITVDPERDTAEVVKEFVSNFHPRLIGLTGTSDEVAAVAKRFGVAYGRAGPEGAKDYLVDHSRVALLFGPEGQPIAILPHDKGAAAIAAELDRWVA